MAAGESAPPNERSTGRARPGLQATRPDGQATRPVVHYARPLLSAADVQDLPGGIELQLLPTTQVTPLAYEEAAARQIQIVEVTSHGPPISPTVAPSRSSAAGLTVALAADHGGFALKQQLKDYLVELGYTVTDVGCDSTEAVDYPDYAYAAARLVATGSAMAAIVVDGAGIGSAMVANKVPGIRAALCYDISSAQNSREHNHANVLTLGAGLIGPALARQIVKTWLETPWASGRHARRVDKIMQIEQRYLKG